nr:uncharacterized protein LOC129461988 isoform X2 [Symphalangus syndactylus]
MPGNRRTAITYQIVHREMVGETKLQPGTRTKLKDTDTARPRMWIWFLVISFPCYYLTQSCWNYFVMISKKIFFSKHSYPKGILKFLWNALGERESSVSTLPAEGKADRGSQNERKKQTGLRLPEMQKLRHRARSLGFKNTECIYTEHNPFSNKETMGLIKKGGILFKDLECWDSPLLLHQILYST